MLKRQTAANPISISPLAIGPGIETNTRSGFNSGASLRYGNAADAVKQLGPITRGAHNLYQVLAGDPGRRIVFMDVVGWCGLRTLIDYNREMFYMKDNVQTSNSNSNNKPKGNIPAAVERVMREIGATASDVAIAGPLVAHLTHLYDARAQQFTGNFLDQGFMAYCQQTAKQLAQQHPPKDVESFLTHLYQQVAQDLGKGQPPAVQAEIKQWLTPKQLRTYMTPETNQLVKVFKNVFGGTKTKFDMVEAERYLANTMNKVGDHTLGHSTLGVDNISAVLNNLHKLQDKVTRQFSTSGLSMAEFAEKMSHSLSIRQKLPLVLGGIFIINLLMPHLIQKNTFNTFGIDSYPGEAGLMGDSPNQSAGNNAPKSKSQHSAFGFISKSLNQGNIVPMLGLVVMLPAILGLYRPGKGLKLDLPKALNWQGLKAYGQKWLKVHDFEAIFPWASEQQQATSYASTLMARMATARSPIEFRERLVDSVLSYTAAFELNGVIDNKIAHFLSQGSHPVAKGLRSLMGITSKPQLIKPASQGGGLRSLNEVFTLTDATVRRDTLAIKTWQAWAATIFTTLTMGVFEPILSIMLTSQQAKWLNRKNTRNHYQNTENLYGARKRVSAPVAFSPFMANTER
jgi:hypothetical protein